MSIQFRIQKAGDCEQNKLPCS